MMQKAIRRGEATLALNAAFTYLSSDTIRFWRRLSVVAAEDIGIGDWKLVVQVYEASADPEWRNDVGGDWVLASLLVHRMIDAAKDRSAVGLIQGPLTHPSLAEARARLGQCSRHELQIIISAMNAPLELRALATLYLMGSSKFRDTQLTKRGSELGALLEVIAELPIPRDLAECCAAHVRSANSALLLMLPLLLIELEQSRCREVIVRQLNAPKLVGDVPLWALDKHTAKGKHAIAQFCRSNSAVRGFLAQNFPAAASCAAVELAVFHTESSCLQKQLIWDRGDELRRFEIEADAAAIGIEPLALLDLMTVVEENLDHLDQIRAQLWVRRRGSK